MWQTRTYWTGISKLGYRGHLQQSMELQVNELYFPCILHWVVASQPYAKTRAFRLQFNTVWSVKASTKSTWCIEITVTYCMYLFWNYWVWRHLLRNMSRETISLDIFFPWIRRMNYKMIQLKQLERLRSQNNGCCPMITQTVDSYQIPFISSQNYWSINLMSKVTLTTTFISYEI